MVVYLSSPGNQMQADHVRGMPVLLSYAVARKHAWIGDYLPSFGQLLVDSGAFTEFSGGRPVDLDAYAEWTQAYRWADAVAALDDIRGDWQRSMENWRRYPWMFPTFHDSDPPEALDTILSYSPEWLGLGLVDHNRENRRWVAETLARIPAGVHVHGWAMRGYADLARLDSADSTNWFRDSWDIRARLPWLTPAECIEIVVKRYQRAPRMAPRLETAGQLVMETER